MSDKELLEAFRYGVRLGALEERERIISLIEDEVSEWFSHDGSCDCKVRGEEGQRLIALIKGENE